MRQIKFRGKRVDNGKWVYGNLVNGSDCIHIVYEAFADDYRWGFENVFIPVAPPTVGQFTGLLDKNGKEIWEGDVIARRGMPNCSIEYGRTKFLLVERTERAEFRYDIDNVFKNHMEVIGSIHDNPELLTNK